MKVRLVLGDQLNENHPWFSQVEEGVVYVQMEMRQETDYAPHHIQKLIAFFGAMRRFEKRIKSKGHQTHYIKLDAEENTQSLTSNPNNLLAYYNATHFSYQSPDEYRLSKQLKTYCSSMTLPTEEVDSFHYMASREELSE